MAVFRFCVDGKQFQNRVFWKRWPNYHHVISLHEFSQIRLITKRTDDFMVFNSCLLWTENIFKSVFRVKPTFWNSSGVLWNGSKWNCLVTSDVFISLLLAAFIDPPGRGASASPSWEQANSKMETTTHNKTKEEEIFFITINKTEQKRTLLNAPLRWDEYTLLWMPITFYT